MGQLPPESARPQRGQLADRVRELIRDFDPSINLGHILWSIGASLLVLRVVGYDWHFAILISLYVGLGASVNDLAAFLRHEGALPNPKEIAAWAIELLLKPKATTDGESDK